MNLQNARLYVITPDASPERVIEIAAAAVRGGADVVQLRHKSLARGELLSLARDLRHLFPIIPSPHRGEGQGEARKSPLFVVNDHVDIALLSDADGVHLGPDDLSIAAARRVAGVRLLIGASASTVEAAQNAIKEGADYVGCGATFATPIKTEKQLIGPAGVARIAASVQPVPLFAIGGIDESNLNQLTAAGVRRVSVIRAVADALDPEDATRRLSAMLSG